jgi:hypothetical protein
VKRSDAQLHFAFMSTHTPHEARNDHLHAARLRLRAPVVCYDLSIDGGALM